MLQGFGKGGRFEGTVHIEKMKCQGMCKQAPVICIHKDECVGKVSKKDAKKLFEKHIA